MLTGLDMSAMATGITISNAVQAHQMLMRHGIRDRPRYDLQIVTSYPILDGIPSLPRLRKVEPGKVLQLEQATFQTKLAHLPRWLGDRGRTRTMIYTHYVREMAEETAAAVKGAGFSVGLYTGSDKNGLEAFLRKNQPVDVLIGSQPLGTGVDGLQKFCNRLIFLSLPWSNAEYEQIIGRLWRTGSNFDKVEVIIPQVVLKRREAGYCPGTKSGSAASATRRPWPMPSWTG